MINSRNQISVYKHLVLILKIAKIFLLLKTGSMEVVKILKQLPKSSGSPPSKDSTHILPMHPGETL
jgi:hypothetical protein